MVEIILFFIVKEQILQLSLSHKQGYPLVPQNRQVNPNLIVKVINNNNYTLYFEMVPDTHEYVSKPNRKVPSDLT